ncbi:serine/threonine protein kinase [Scytonema hofmannii PCC 7110]|uniref:non-specific serine/threonine protein kinase n=1 Tax=Scytonema hofmannii PCC 7110 TaxID=128403 RepID=A0A139XB36_9CYAN|nr:serine/threonine-protein kinase [Scytonema hofmannii]KYC41917.1 serine/threonine protein kinase [Scytonema hofmannii PCC 7110]
MIGRLLDQRYLVVELLGMGGFGHTYTAQDTRRPGNPVCVVKHLKPATDDLEFLQIARRLFRREAETLEKLGNHDQIPRLLAYFEEQQEFFLVQEYIAGHQLAMELPLGQRWDESQTIHLLQDVLPILEFLHNNEVIHRDIKPQNLIRRHSDNKLVLVDFGAVKQIQMYSLMNPNQLNNETIPIGTPGYMPSEQAQGRPRPNSDIYALGAIAIQALTGLNPKQFATDAKTGEIIWRQYAQVSDPLADLLTKMVRQYYKYRYESASDTLEALTSFTHPRTRAAVAVAVKYVLQNYLREGYASATKMVRSLQELAKPCYHPAENTKTPDTTQLPTTPSSQVPGTQSTVLIPDANLPASNTSSSHKGFPIKSPRQIQLLVGGGAVIALVALSVISANPPQQKSASTTQEKTIQETQKAGGTNTQKSTVPDKISQQNQFNNCFITTRASNVRSVSGRRRTGKVIKAGTRVTVTGKEEGGWIELSAPEPGWIWKSRTKNTCQ